MNKIGIKLQRLTFARPDGQNSSICEEFLNPTRTRDFWGKKNVQKFWIFVLEYSNILHALKLVWGTFRDCSSARSWCFTRVSTLVPHPKRAHKRSAAKSGLFVLVLLKSWIVPPSLKELQLYQNQRALTLY